MEHIIDLVFPKRCLSCQNSGGYICSQCISKVRPARKVCPLCDRASIDGFTHAKCQTKLGFNGLISIWKYEGVVRKAIVNLKYKYATEIASELVRFITIELKKYRSILIDRWLIPIPIHWYRENVRGFNQSYELGRRISKEMEWRFVPNILIRKKLTVPQVQLSSKDRKVNIKGVFSAHSLFDLKDKNIIVFDDVYTTGSTLKEAIKVLKRKGANSVWGLTIAK